MNKIELKFEYSKLWVFYGGLICHAAIGLITRTEAAQLLDIHIAEVARRVNDCNIRAKQLLDEYRGSR